MVSFELTPVRVHKTLYRIQYDSRTRDGPIQGTTYKNYPYISTSMTPFLYFDKSDTLTNKLLIIKINDDSQVSCLMMPRTDIAKYLEFDASIRKLAFDG